MLFLPILHAFKFIQTIVFFLLFTIVDPFYNFWPTPPPDLDNSHMAQLYKSAHNKYPYMQDIDPGYSHVVLHISPLLGIDYSHFAQDSNIG